MSTSIKHIPVHNADADMYVSEKKQSSLFYPASQADLHPRKPAPRPNQYLDETVMEQPSEEIGYGVGGWVEQGEVSQGGRGRVRAAPKRKVSSRSKSKRRSGSSKSRGRRAKSPQSTRHSTRRMR